MSKRSRDDKDVPDVARSAGRVKREEEDGGDHGRSAVSPEATAQDESSAPIILAPAAVPKLSDIAKLVMNDLFSDNADVFFQAAHRLACDRKVGKQALLSGAHLATIRAMRIWEANAKILSVCCALLENFLNANFELRMEFMLTILSLGAMEMLVTAMRRFPNARDIQQYGCGALTYLFAMEVCVDRYRARFVLELNGVALVVKAMEKYHNKPWIQKCGCEILFYLSIEKNIKWAIIKEGGSTAASKVLQRDFGLDTKKVHEWAEKLMKRLFA